LLPSKGVHLLFPLPADWGRDALLVPKTEDGRVVFALPYNGRLLVGTTDTAATPSDELVITRQEIDYLLRQISPYLARPLPASEIVSGFAGLRPLVRSGNSRDTSSIIRDDEVEVDPETGLISILGGKWTTYRLMAEKTIDHVSPGGCVTRTTPLAGSRAQDVLRLARESPDLLEPLIEGAPPIRAEVVYAVRHEMALTVEDVIARRIGLELYDWRMSIEAAPIVADLPRTGTERPRGTVPIENTPSTENGGPVGQTIAFCRLSPREARPCSTSRPCSPSTDATHRPTVPRSGRRTSSAAHPFQSRNTHGDSLSPGTHLRAQTQHNCLITSKPAHIVDPLDLHSTERSAMRPIWIGVLIEPELGNRPEPIDSNLVSPHASCLVRDRLLRIPEVNSHRHNCHDDCRNCP
jgi:hypothetical protein